MKAQEQEGYDAQPYLRAHQAWNTTEASDTDQDGQLGREQPWLWTEVDTVSHSGNNAEGNKWRQHKMTKAANLWIN